MTLLSSNAAILSLVKSAGQTGTPPEPSSAIVFDPSTASSGGTWTVTSDNTVSTTTGASQNIKGDRGVQGKIYIEMMLANGRDGGAGLVTFSTDMETTEPFNGNANETALLYVLPDPDRLYDGSGFATAYPALIPSNSDPDILMMAMDTSTGEVWVGLNGSWDVGADPETGTSPSDTGLASGVDWTILAVPTNTSVTTRIITQASEMTHTIPAGFVAISEGTEPPVGAIVFDASTASEQDGSPWVWTGDGTKTISNNSGATERIKGDRGVTGKLYIEMLLDSTSRNGSAGLVVADTDLVTTDPFTANTNRSAFYYPFTAPDRLYVGTGSPVTLTGFDSPVNAAADILMMALDTATGEVWVGLNGTWYNGGNPATGTTPTYSTLDTGESWTTCARPAASGGALQTTIRTEASDMTHTIPAGFVAISEGT